MKLPDIHHYDTYVPILSNLQNKRHLGQAVKLVIDSLEPLGDEYCRTLHEGLTRPLVRPLSEPGQAERRVLAPAATTASRTS